MKDTVYKINGAYELCGSVCGYPICFKEHRHWWKMRSSTDSIQELSPSSAKEIKAIASLFLYIGEYLRNISKLLWRIEKLWEIVVNIIKQSGIIQTGITHFL